MQYHLLTGATGLLGCYLLRDATRARIPLAIVARSSRRESARQRIEDILLRWERQAGTSLPRPVVLEGDLSQPGLGLASAEREWIAENCHAAIHNAASLTFSKRLDTGEPFTTNVTGTQYFLELCQQTGIRRLHHVSTAYICGLREGRILESELDVGQELGNDYELSKLQAECMVRECPWLEEVTCYRPGIIVGDSRTGYTSTFHGFYVPLKIAHALIYKVVANTVRGTDLVKLVGMTGGERKNFVPVDWVSQVMTRIIATPALHGRTFHLTPAERVTLQEMAEVMEEVLVACSSPDRDASQLSRPSFDRTFRDHLDVYRSYWRDDPEFDTTETSRAAPDLPCPRIDRRALTRLCTYAVRSGFGWPKTRSVSPQLDADQWLNRLVGQRDDRPAWYLGLQVNGPGGGQWELAVSGELIRAVRPGITDRCLGVAYLNAHTLRRLIRQQTDCRDALRQGRLVVQIELPRISQTLAALQQLMSAGGEPLLEAAAPESLQA